MRLMSSVLSFTLAGSLIVSLAACGDKAEGDDGGAQPGRGDGADGTDGTDGTDGADGADGTDGTDGTDGSDGGDGTDGTDGSGAFAPSEGHWTYTGAGSLISDTCNYSGDPPGGSSDPGFGLSMNGAAAFDLTPDGSADPFDCDLTNKSFACGAITGAEPIDGVSATLQVSIGVQGTFSDASSSNLRYDLHIDCTGGDCGLVEFGADISFPCDVAFNADATAD